MRRIAALAEGETSPEPPAQQAAHMPRVAPAGPCAFEELFAEYQRRVVGLAYRLLGWSAHETEDVVQEVFMAAWKNMGRFEERSSLWTWLARITINECRRLLRRQRLWRMFSRRRAQTEDRCADPTEDSARREQQAWVRDAIRALPMKLREVIVLRYLQEMPVADVAATLGLSDSAVRVRLHRARQRLRQRLEPLRRE